MDYIALKRYLFDYKFQYDFDYLYIDTTDFINEVYRKWDVVFSRVQDENKDQENNLRSIFIKKDSLILELGDSILNIQTSV